MSSSYCYWQELICVVSQFQVELMSEAMEEVGALAVRFEASDEQPLFRENLHDEAFWSQTKVIALFNDQVNMDSVIQSLCAKHSSLKKNQFIIDRIEDQDWVRLTQEQFTPQCIANRLWVCPTGQEVDDDAMLLRIDPGLAFGTGTHPTTRLCLEWLCQHDLRNQVVLDYGCGSGILSIAALLLGAKQVFAVDHDPQALIATRSNALLNDVVIDQQLMIGLDVDFTPIVTPVLVANILLGPLLELKERFSQCLPAGGLLVLSGVLEEQLPRLRQCYAEHFTEIAVTLEEGWACVVWSKSSSI